MGTLGGHKWDIGVWGGTQGHLWGVRGQGWRGGTGGLFMGRGGCRGDPGGRVGIWGRVGTLGDPPVSPP